MLDSYTALTTELNTDPTALGYKIAGVFRDDSTLAGILNQVRTTILIPRGIIPTWHLLNAVAPSELTALTATQLNIFLALSSLGTLSIDSPNIRAILSALFPLVTAPTTNANLVALRTRPGSRIEQIYGSGISVGHTDIAIALGRI